MSRFVTGASYPLRGLAFIRANRLWGYCFGIVVLNTAVFGLLVFAGVSAVRAVAERFAVAESGFGHVLLIAAWVVATALVVGLSGVVLALVSRALAGPLLDALSEKVETLVTGRREEPMNAARILRTMRIGFTDVVCSALLTVTLYAVLLVLGFVPIVGAVAASVLGYALTALVLAHELIGLPLARRFVGYGGRWSFVLRHGGVALGFGAMTFVVLLVPILGFFGLAAATAGATLLYVDLARERADLRPN